MAQMDNLGLCAWGSIDPFGKRFRRFKKGHSLRDTLPKEIREEFVSKEGNSLQSF